MTTDTVAEDRDGDRGRLDGRRHGQGRRHARARPGHHALRPHHRRRRRPADDCDAALRAATARTFDRVDSDGCMSTNDTVLLLASGASGRTPRRAELRRRGRAGLRRPGQQLLADAEGATKDIAVEVVGAATEDDAVEVGRAVARSNLLKCALFGNDPNWGRVLAAVGTTAAAFEPDELDVAINGV